MGSLEADFHSAKSHKSFETSPLAFCKAIHIYFLDKASRILPVEGAVIAEHRCSIANYVRMLTTFHIPASTLSHALRHLYLQVL